MNKKRFSLVKFCFKPTCQQTCSKFDKNLGFATFHRQLYLPNFVPFCLIRRLLSILVF